MATITITAPLLTVADVARLLSVSEFTVRRKIVAGELEAFRTGLDRRAPYRIEPGAVERFLQPGRRTA
jgi:excisionase family DNA binding protein